MSRFTRKCVVDRKIVESLILKKSFNEIARTLKVGKRRIRTVNNLAKERGYLADTALPPYPHAIFDYKEAQALIPASLVDETLMGQIEWIKSKRELEWHWITILEELPVKVSSSSFYRFIKRHNLNPGATTHKRVVPEIIHDPGESLILDWGKLSDVTDPDTGKKRTLWFLVGVMGHSRYMMVRLVWDNKLETTLHALESMLNELGGVPQKLTSDNPKCFATTASKYEPILNTGFERFCSHYGVIPEMLPPYDPEKKGKVEKMVPYVRRLNEACGEFVSMEESQKYLDVKMSIANERKHGTTKLQPLDVFLQTEEKFLKELPETSFAPEEYHSGVVRQDGHVRFRGKYYSLDEGLIGREVFIVGTAHTVEIFHLGMLVETHPRLTCAFQAKSTKKHHLKIHEQMMTDNQFYLDRAHKLGPNVEEMINSILQRGNGFVDSRSIWGILNLDKDHAPDKVNLACKYALECDQLGYRAVLRFINLNPHDEKLIKKSSNNKFLRDPSEYVQQTLLH